MAFKNTFSNLYSVLITTTTTTSALVVGVAVGRTGFRRLFLAIACRFHRVINPRLPDKTNAIARACRDLRVCDRPGVYGHTGTLASTAHSPVLGLVVPARVALDTNSIRGGGGGGRRVGRQVPLVEQVHIIRSSIPSGTLTGPDARRTCKRTRSHRCTCRPNLSAAVAAQAHKTDQAPSTLLLYPVGQNVFINTADDCQKAKGTKLSLLLLCVLQQYFMFSKFFFTLSTSFSTIRRSRPSSFNTILIYYIIRFVQKTTDTRRTPRHISAVVSVHFSSFSRRSFVLFS